MKQTAFLLFCTLLLLPVRSFAEPTSSGPDTLRRAMANVSFVETLLARQDDRAEWQSRMSAAEARRSRGLRYTLIGGGVTLVGGVIAGVGSPTYYLDDGNDAAFALGALMVLGGAGVCGYGVYQWIKGSEEVDNLDREGRLRGYLSLAARAWNASLV